jgi:hypothetical protein
MPDLLTAPRHRPVARSSAPVALILVVAVAVALIAGAEVAPARAKFVRHVSITNPLTYQVETEVAGADRTSWIGLGPVERQHVQSFEQVFDVGRRWVFRFSYSGITGGEITASRAQLERARWRVIVPPDVGHRFEAAGLPPSGGGSR